MAGPRAPPPTQSPSTDSWELPNPFRLFCLGVGCHRLIPQGGLSERVLQIPGCLFFYRVRLFAPLGRVPEMLYGGCAPSLVMIQGAWLGWGVSAPLPWLDSSVESLGPYASPSLVSGPRAGCLPLTRTMCPQNTEMSSRGLSKYGYNIAKRHFCQYFLAVITCLISLIALY